MPETTEITETTSNWVKVKNWFVRKLMKFCIFWTIVCLVAFFTSTDGKRHAIGIVQSIVDWGKGVYEDARSASNETDNASNAQPTAENEETNEVPNNQSGSSGSTSTDTGTSRQTSQTPSAVEPFTMTVAGKTPVQVITAYRDAIVIDEASIQGVADARNELLGRVLRELAKGVAVDVGRVYADIREAARKLQHVGATPEQRGIGVSLQGYLDILIEHNSMTDAHE